MKTRVWLCNYVQTLPVVKLHRTIQLVKCERMHMPQMPLKRTFHKFFNNRNGTIMNLGMSVSRLAAPASALLLLWQWLEQKVNDIVRSKLIAEL